MKKLLLRLASSTIGFALLTSSQAAELEGYLIKESAVVGNAKLVLNGAAVSKRGYFKTGLTAIYLSEPRHTLEGAIKLHGAKRIEITILRDLTGSMMSRYFIADFKQAATETEFKQLIPEIGRIGGMYATLTKVSKGDIAQVDWIPGTGIVCYLNGKLQMDGQGPMNSELMFQVLMRMYMTAGTSPDSEYQRALLGS